MAKRAVHGESCMVCNAGVCKLCATIALLLGIIFLLQDLGKWDFWGINWWTVAFLLVGLFGIFGKK